MTQNGSTIREREAPLTLNALDRDALREIYKHVRVPLALKLVCRAIRDAWPEATKSYAQHAHETLAQLQWACGTGMKVFHGLVEGVAARGQLDQLLWMEHSSSDIFVDDEVHVAAFKYKKGFHVYHEAANTAAARHGHIHIVERFAPVGRSFMWWEPIYRAAGFGGQLETLKWLSARYGERDLDCSVLVAAAGGGHLETIKWMHVEKGVSWDEKAITVAARCGHVHVLEWLHSCAQPPSDDTWKDGDPGYWAVEYGHLPVLEWAREQLGAPSAMDWQGWADQASRHGHVHILRWMRGLGAEFGGDFARALRVAMDVSYWGASLKHLNVLKWAHAEGMVTELRQAYLGPWVISPYPGLWENSDVSDDDEETIKDWFAKTFPDLAQ